MRGGCRRPERWMAQDVVNLSTVPTVGPNGVLVPATWTCARSRCSASASTSSQEDLTRVALDEGSLIVNSSRGGGSKDTWVLETATTPTAQAPRSPTPAPGAAGPGHRGMGGPAAAAQQRSKSGRAPTS